MRFKELHCVLHMRSEHSQSHRVIVCVCMRELWPKGLSKGPTRTGCKRGRRRQRAALLSLPVTRCERITTAERAATATPTRSITPGRTLLMFTVEACAASNLGGTGNCTMHMCVCMRRCQNTQNAPHTQRADWKLHMMTNRKCTLSRRWHHHHPLDSQ